MIRNESYINIQGFMVTEMGLKGNELLIYAIIYGFSQDGQSHFTGTLQYLAEWTNSTKQGVLQALQKLVDKGFIGRQEKIVNKVKYVEYYSTYFNGGVKQSLMGGIKQSLPNNIDKDNINNNIKEIYKEKTSSVENDTTGHIENDITINNNKINDNNINNNNNNNNNINNKLSDEVKEIIDYLNDKANKHFRVNSAPTVKVIQRLLKEKYTVDDFKKVIDKKVKSWGNDKKMRDYLRPETLFCISHFESYLNEEEKEEGGIFF